MKKTPFVTKEQVEEIAKTYPTPFYLYDEKGIRENARKMKKAFCQKLVALRDRTSCFLRT